MDYYEKALGKTVRFLLPSLKLKERCSSGETIEQSVHDFLVESFKGYTATSATVFGYWKDNQGTNSYGEHREFTVALSPDEGLSDLKDFLGRTALIMRESCLYFEVAGEAVLIYSSEDPSLLDDPCAAVSLKGAKVANGANGAGGSVHGNG